MTEGLHLRTAAVDINLKIGNYGQRLYKAVLITRASDAFQRVHAGHITQLFSAVITCAHTIFWQQMINAAEI